MNLGIDLMIKFMFSMSWGMEEAGVKLRIILYDYSSISGIFDF